MTPPLMPGAEAWSYATDHPVGVLALHGFTGNPSSMRGVAEAMAAAGFQVELPRLPGHGTSIDDMLPTRWHDWAGEALAALDRLQRRCDQVVAAGLSMGGALALWSALERPRVRALICVNPVTTPPAPEVRSMIEEFLDDGLTVVPGSGSDVADPDAVDLGYDGTPLAPAQSLFEAVADITHRFGELTVPLRLFTSRQDHVVAPADSEHLAATYGGEVEHTWLERSYHVATRDFDRHLIEAASVDFVQRVTVAGRIS